MPIVVPAMNLDEFGEAGLPVGVSHDFARLKRDEVFPCRGLDADVESLPSVSAQLPDFRIVPPAGPYLVAVLEPAKGYWDLHDVGSEFLEGQRCPERVPQGNYGLNHAMDEEAVPLGKAGRVVLSFPRPVNVASPIGKDDLKLGHHGKTLGIGRVVALDSEGYPFLAI